MERQLLELLQGLHQTKAHRTDPDPATASGSPGQTVPGQEAGSVCRKVIQAQDVCPICQEELLQKKQPACYCRCVGVEVPHLIVSVQSCFKSTFIALLTGTWPHAALLIPPQPTKLLTHSLFLGSRQFSIVSDVIKLDPNLQIVADEDLFGVLLTDFLFLPGSAAVTTCTSPAWRCGRITRNSLASRRRWSVPCAERTSALWSCSTSRWRTPQSSLPPLKERGQKDTWECSARAAESGPSPAGVSSKPR